MITRLWGRIVCLVMGHKRGKRVGENWVSSMGLANGGMIYRCPRCHATWTRKVKAKAATI